MKNDISLRRISESNSKSASVSELASFSVSAPHLQHRAFARTRTEKPNRRGDAVVLVARRSAPFMSRFSSDYATPVRDAKRGMRRTAPTPRAVTLPRLSGGESSGNLPSTFPRTTQVLLLPCSCNTIYYTRIDYFSKETLFPDLISYVKKMSFSCRIK